MNIGITGQSGFIGYHLSNTIKLNKNFNLIPFEDNFFQDKNKLETFVKQCDVVVHLAALNRHNDEKTIFETNINLVKFLIEACENTNSKPHIIFSSSTQEERDNVYGRSKRVGREMFEQWAEKNNAQFTGLIIPNVFGPFGNPYYNSFIATFCYQLTHNETPRIEVDNVVKLIYVKELVDYIINIINDKSKEIKRINVPHSYEIKVSETLKILNEFTELYFKNGIIPDLNTKFKKDLFNTYLCYIDHKNFYPFRLKENKDNRGIFVEIIKFHNCGQVSYSTTYPSITRGNHFHMRKAERFVVVKGKARIDLRRIGRNEVMSFYLDGDHPSFVDMPIWHTHNITNIGDEDLVTIFWTDEFFNPEDPDTYFEQV